VEGLIYKIVSTNLQQINAKDSALGSNYMWDCISPLDPLPKNFNKTVGFIHVTTSHQHEQGKHRNTQHETNRHCIFSDISTFDGNYKRLFFLVETPSDWHVKKLSIGGRLILVEFAFSIVPSYMISIFRIPKGVLKRCNSIKLVLS
jgi:hypothetical protein